MTDKPTVMLSKEVVFQLAKKLIEKGDVDAFNSQFMLMTRQMFEQVEQSIRADKRQAVLAEISELVDKMPAFTMTNPHNNHPANAYKLIDKVELRAKLAEMGEGNDAR